MPHHSMQAAASKWMVLVLVSVWVGACQGASPEKKCHLLDAGSPFGVSQYDYCNLPFFRLPIDGQNQTTWGMDMHGNRLAYAVSRKDDHEWVEVHSFDIGTCKDHLLTRCASAREPAIWGNLIFWHDFRNDLDAQDYPCAEVYNYDVAAWQEQRLATQGDCAYQPKTNGRYIAYRTYSRTSPYPDCGGYYYLPCEPEPLMLRDTITGDEIQVSSILSDTRGAPVYDLGELYMAWTSDASGPSRGVHYFDIENRTYGYVEPPPATAAIRVRVWGDYLTYVTWWGGGLQLYNMSTGEEWETGGRSYYTIGDYLVAWYTTRYSFTFEKYPGDVEMFDIRSLVYRRLTTRASNLTPWIIQFPYLLVFDKMVPETYHTSNWYVADLVKLGITDADGNLLPGDPVIEPPQ